MGEVDYEVKVVGDDKWLYALYRHETFRHTGGGVTVISDLVGKYDSIDSAQAQLRYQQRLDVGRAKK